MQSRFHQFRLHTVAGSLVLAALLYAGDGASSVVATPAAPRHASGMLGQLRGLSAWLDSGHRAARSAVTLGLRN